VSTIVTFSKYYSISIFELCFAAKYVYSVPSFGNNFTLDVASPAKNHFNGECEDSVILQIGLGHLENAHT